MTRYSPGQTILAKGAPFRKTDTLNSVLECAEEYALQRRLGEQGSRQNVPQSTDLLKVKNDTGGALRFGEVIELNGSAINPIVYRYPWFNAAVPNESRPFAIMLEPLASGETKPGLAQSSGICPALINITNTGDLWAFVSSGSKVLQSHPFWGDVRIAFQPGSTGEQGCWVIFEKYLGELLVKNETGADKTGGTFADYVVYTGSQSSPSSTGRTVNCFNKTTASFKNGKCGAAAMLSRRPYCVPYEQ